MSPRDPRQQVPGWPARYRPVRRGLRRWFNRGTDWKPCRVMDLGRGGAGLLADDVSDTGTGFEVGDPIRLEITPEWPPSRHDLKIVLMGEVRNQRLYRDGHWRIGVRFVRANDRDQRLLGVLVAPASTPQGARR